MTEQKSLPTIPFNRPHVSDLERRYVLEALEVRHLSGDGPFTKRCHAWMEASLGAPKVLLTHSGTAALEMAALLANIGPGDEVVMPTFTFVSTANAFALRGAKLRFVDIRPDTMNLDEAKLEEVLTPRTKVVVPVHYAGVACEMDAILELARSRRLLVVEDAAQGVGATYKGRPLGTLGELGAYSFHETKNVASGEGGALAVNDRRFAERAEIIREKGTNRSQFFRGQVDKYTWVDIGSSYLPSEIQAAFLFAQLEQTEEITRGRLEIFRRYEEGLRTLEVAGRIRMPRIPAGCGHNGHMFYLLAGSLEERTRLIAYLKQRQIHAVFHYIPLHVSPMGRSLGYAVGDFPVAEDISDRLLRLPFYYGLTEADQARVVDAVQEFYRSW